jgi:hypothetical protein
MEFDCPERNSVNPAESARLGPNINSNSTGRKNTVEVSEMAEGEDPAEPADLVRPNKQLEDV